MKLNRNMVINALSIVLGVYLVLGMTAFNNPDNSDLRCNEVEINIEGGITDGFLTKEEIAAILRQKQIATIGMLPDSINIRKAEAQLQSSPFVKNVECSITEEGNLKIDVAQRLPIVHVKTYHNDYYIDETGNIMPPSAYQSDLIVATGYITKGYARTHLVPLITTINADEFWHSQIEQVNILPNKGVELVPRVGNHVVYIGALPALEDQSSQKEAIESLVRFKLRRLYKFYRYGLNKVGWNKYSDINLEYDNQIICKKITSSSNTTKQ